MVNQEKGRRGPVTQGLQGEQRPPLANTGDSCRQQKWGLAFGSGSGFHPFPDVSVTERRDQVLKAKATMKMFKQSKKKWLEQLLKMPSQHGAPRVQGVRIISKLAKSTLSINIHHLSYAGEAILSIMANRKTHAARQLPPRSH